MASVYIFDERDIDEMIGRVRNASDFESLKDALIENIRMFPTEPKRW